MSLRLINTTLSGRTAPFRSARKLSVPALLILGGLLGCSHPLEIVGQGDIRSASGERDCSLEEYGAAAANCRHNLVVGAYNEEYNAVPRAGWQFEGWENCIYQLASRCVFSVKGSLVQQYWGQSMLPLRAIFRPSEGVHYDITGTITVSAGVAIDSDVNDPLAPYMANDTLDTGQPIDSPVTLYGYLNTPGQGEPGRSQLQGDENDYFTAYLNAGEEVTIEIGHPDVPDIDLYLRDIEGRIVDSSAGVSQMERLIVDADGQYLVHVVMRGGASTYVLKIEESAGESMASTATLSSNFVPHQAIVKYRDTETVSAASTGGTVSSSMNSSDRPMLIELVNQKTSSSGVTAAQFSNSDRDVESGSHCAEEFLRAGDCEKWATLMALKDLNKNPDVEYAEPNFIVSADAPAPNDEHFPDQWAHSMIHTLWAWDTTRGAGVTVAVIDSGLALDHPDLGAAPLPGFDFVSSITNAGDGDGIDPFPEDIGDGSEGSQFHGTHVSGIIGATPNNQIGIAGIAPEARILPLRVLGMDGFGTIYDINQAVRYATGLPNDSGEILDNPVDVINLSLGGSGYSQSSQDLYNLVRQAGIVVVAAAGNEDSREPHYPAAYSGVLSVSAVGRHGARAMYSNKGATIDLAAPGGDIYRPIGTPNARYGVVSTVGGGNKPEGKYRWREGTSMSSAHVSAVIALMRSVRPDLYPNDIDDMLTRGLLTDDWGQDGRDNHFGHGLINASKAIEAAQEYAGPPPDPEIYAVPNPINLGRRSGEVLSLRAIGPANFLNFTVEADWVQIAPDRLPDDGLGDYQILIDRSGLEDGDYSTSIYAVGDYNVEEIVVAMKVRGADFRDMPGPIVVYLEDSLSGEVIASATAHWADGAIPFKLWNIPPGDYVVRAGTDTDNSGDTCHAAEACAALGGKLSPQVLSVHDNLENIDFNLAP